MTNWAQEISWRRQAGVPLDFKPNHDLADEETAYRVQADANFLLAKSLGPVEGLKIGCTTPVMQAFLGIDSPAAGEIFASTIYGNETFLRHSEFRKPGVECELAVRIGKDIAPKGPRPAPEDVVASFHAAAEIVDDRYVDYQALGIRFLIADNFFNAGALVGPPVSAWRDMDLGAIRGKTVINGKERGSGLGASIMGHPLKALDWLIGRRRDLGLGIARDTIVLLGSLVETQWLERGDEVEITLEGLGSLGIGVV
jgi:2-keto-4-pentenoate hydratase